MPGCVLVVENSPTWATQIREELTTKLSCAVEVVPDSKVLADAQVTSSDRDYAKVIVNAVENAFQRDSFDVATINLNLKIETTGLLGTGDLFGETILSHVLQHHPGITSIVYTAQQVPSAKAFTNRYNALDIITKTGLPDQFELLCEAVQGALAFEHPFKRKIGDRTYELKGIANCIYRTLHNRGIIAKVFDTIPDYDSRLVTVLASSLPPNERAFKAAHLISDLWHLDRSLPSYPLVFALGKMEFGRSFWEGHRDHVVHQLLVYLLGLYLYYGSDTLRQALTKRGSEAHFLRAWKIAALFHDLGYVFELPGSEQGVTNEKAFDELNELRFECLHHYFNSRKISILPAEGREIVHQAEPYIQWIKAGDIVAMERHGKDDLFRCLEAVATDAHLGDTGKSLLAYWEFAQTHSTVDPVREGFADHGIASALVLLQQYYSLRCVFTKAAARLGRRKTFPTSAETARLVVEHANEIQKGQTAVELAAAAIALHNINVDIWEPRMQPGTKEG